MDRDHRLDAPNNEELKTIEQIEDRSLTSTVYRDPKELFKGDILSAEERQRVKDEQLASITNGLWKSSLKIGLYVPYPFVSGALLAAILNASVEFVNAALMIGLLIVVTGIWLLTSYNSYVQIFKIFYKHALRAMPFISIMLLNVVLISEAIYDFVAETFAGQSLVFNVAIISLFTVLYIILATFIILAVWGNSKIHAGVKVAVAGGVTLISGLLALASYLL